ncbi:MAG: nucleotidyltransferase family protein [Deltaproteobacteria bacterium]|nr:nucleotidyltransferase family protein [Deltaproteobacteria bacterium]
MSQNGGLNITRAMVLAAGLGTRLRPLTDRVPKPLLPVGDKPLLDRALAQLAAGGVRDVMINLHYLPEAIRSHVGDGSAFGLRAHFSLEPQILGTGGGVRQVLEFFRGEPFVLMNADTLIQLDLADLIATHRATPGAAATLVVRALEPGEHYTALACDGQGRLRAFGHGAHHYTGVMVGTATLLQQLPSQRPACLVADGLKPLLAANTVIQTYWYRGYWNDVGTPERYAAAQVWAATATP